MVVKIVQNIIVK